MMQFIWNPTESEADIVVSDGTIQVDDGLEAAVLISIFSDARARDDDDMTGLSKDKRGWWADTFADATGANTGSRLWLRKRTAIGAKLLADVKQDIQDALQWLISDGVASAVSVTTERFGLDGIEFSVGIAMPTAASPRWFRIWRIRANGV